ncbi:hypothetical protein Tco_0600360 [Tanacetum coccineum]|uniref:Uncharacterized protein n=1 Tax=Tanacetum coccineum TaxID=301880 RepID=A0ABQ4WBK7_9ASTR
MRNKRLKRKYFTSITTIKLSELNLKVEAFKLDLEESPPEATDERCKNVETHGSEAILESMNPWTLKATHVAIDKLEGLVFMLPYYHCYLMLSHSSTYCLRMCIMVDIWFQWINQWLQLIVRCLESQRTHFKFIKLQNMLTTVQEAGQAKMCSFVSSVPAFEHNNELKGTSFIIFGRGMCNIDFLCLIVNIYIRDNTWLAVSGNAQMVHLGNMDGNDIDAQRRVRGKCTEKQCPYMTMARRDVIKGTSYVNLTASDPTLLGFYRPNCRSKKLDALNNAYRGCELSTSLYWMVFVHLYSLSHVKPIRSAFPSI